MAKNSNNTKTTIELNGKLYDARTGRPVDASAAEVAQSITPTNTVSPAAAPATPAAASPGRNVDGFFRPSGGSVSNPLTVSSPAATSSPAVNPARMAAPSLQKRSLEKSQTLMRSAVQAPVINQSSDPQTTTDNNTAGNAQLSAANGSSANADSATNLSWLINNAKGTSPESTRKPTQLDDLSSIRLNI